MELGSAIQYVTGGLSLVAFIVAALFYSYRARLQQRTEIILGTPKNQRVAAIDATADFLRIDTTLLTDKMRETIILKQLEIRARRELMFFAAALFIALLLAFISIVSLLHGTPEHPPSPERASASSAPREISTITANYVVCVGEYAQSCPQNSVHLACGSSVADWAKKECKSFGQTQLSNTPGNHCGYATVQVTCTKSVSP